MCVPPGMTLRSEGFVRDGAMAQTVTKHSLETKFTQDYLNIHRMPISSCQLRPDGRISHPELPATSDATKCRQPVVKIEYGDEPHGFPYLIMVCSQRRIWR